MFDNIVVPLDRSVVSEAALSYVTPLAKGLDAAVVLLLAENDPYSEILGGGGGAASPYQFPDSEGGITSSVDYLGEVCERLRAQGIRCETYIDQGAPAAVILNYIERRSPDLIAMSTHGFSGFRRMVVGSVTTTILPRARIPLLAVHPGGDGADVSGSFESLIIPLDMSERSEDVLPLAARLADTLKLDVTLVTCLPSPGQLYTGSSPEVFSYPDDLIQQAQDAAEQYLAGVCDDFNEEHRLNARWECLEGGPASTIVEFAASQPNPLIAMCTQGRTGLGRWVLGSVTDAVIRTGSTPVLVIPHPDESE